jgi:ribosomal protein L7/L12
MSSLSTEQERQIKELLAQGQKIAAIKLYREATGSSLKDSKDAVEAMERGATNYFSAAAHGSEPDPFLENRIKRLLAERKKIEAIKLYREAYNCGLKEAKDAVERIQAGLHREEYSSTPSLPVANNDPFAGDSQRTRSCLVLVVALLVLLLGGVAFLFLTGNGF